jgi:hypothetical protein
MGTQGLIALPSPRDALMPPGRARPSRGCPSSRGNRFRAVGGDFLDSARFSFFAAGELSGPHRVKGTVRFQKETAMKIAGALLLTTVLTIGFRISWANEPGAGSPSPAQLLRGRASQQIEAVGGKTTPTERPRGRYRTLLRTFAVPSDHESYGDFYDWGYWSGTSYAGHDDLPPGFWVYVAPNWYIFKDAAADQSASSAAPRAWGPEQATGAPDTWPKSGDIGTAWASKTPDGQREWLELKYDSPIRPIAVLVYETYNPGALDRVTCYDAAGSEVELWAGADPTPVGKDRGISVIPVQPVAEFSRIRLYLDSPKVAGWNEIDAVGLLDESGQVHWATSATASSTYAEMSDRPAVDILRLRGDQRPNARPSFP